MQVPAPFTYERATSVEHAIELLGQLGPEARVVAGGHSLIPMMKLRLARPDALVDINDLGAELAQIRVDGDALVIGALARHADVLASAVVGEHFPIFHDAERVIADPVVRNFGTVGGSLCQADPAEDLAAVFAALDAVAVLRGAAGVREVRVRELHVGPYETVLAPDELMLELRVPIRPGGGSAYEKVERRVGDYPVAAAGAAVWLDGDTVRDVGIGLTAVGAEHFTAPAAEEALRGQPATEESFQAAARLAAEHCNPSADQRGPVDYKRHLAAELTTRALRRAAARARGQEA
ncbi:FAD binding domain-containing protein [Asanoa siamensis]|uniref:Carbon monoxide dehydrogenase medium subunit n=1 Tax=Asanoa siamensis TaxID=926357 RepID=A0ABQ4D2L6_9ACTN|nr:xanthine dehydrogenase family protein subunit M [Asanoa siamensis]GIF77362.1 carbon monoxide dehydrogenase medium subunit [Asanoa siamensis]